MTLIAERQTEPIPGYRLLERIGAGGFGEVWKAEAPGGILKAIKLVHGNLRDDPEESSRIQQELRALNRVKAVRHPFILSLERIDVVDGRLLIVMELADRNLWDRYRECRATPPSSPPSQGGEEGRVGIPREELLRYVEEAAEALDLMNQEHGLQHLDIKPQNLFLVHHHLKVGDFGLVTDMSGVRSQLAGGVTPLYAAPETFDGVLTPFTDQYSLAVVYMELLTGQHPFPGVSPRELLLHFLTGKPDLTPLPASDQPAIARALSIRPEDRFPTCRDLVWALRGQPAPAPVATAPPLPNRQQDTQVLQMTPVIHEGRTFPAAPGSVTPVTRAPAKGNGILLPALVLGVGGVGLNVLRQFRRALRERWESPAAVLPNVRLLHIDADPDALGQARQGEAPLDEKESLIARLERPAHYLKPVRGQRLHDRWLDANVLCRLPREQVVPTGLRCLGRLAFVENYDAIRARLQAELEACSRLAALEAADQQTRLGLRSHQPRVYIVVSLAGGTGSGMFLDLAFTVRRLLLRQGYVNPDVVGLFLVPAIDAQAPDLKAWSNACAALRELASFSAAGAPPSSTYFHEGAEVLDGQGKPFRHCILVPMAKSGDEAAALAGDFLCRDLTTSLGPVADTRRAALTQPGEAGRGLTVSAFGACRFAMPRRAIIRQAGRRLVHRLVRDWLSSESGAIRDEVAAWITEQVNRWEIRPDVLTEKLKSACAQALARTPEDAFNMSVECFVVQKTDASAAIQALARIEELVGKRPTARPEDARPGLLEHVLDDAVRGLLAAWDQVATDICLGLLEEPRFRLAGAEEAVRRLIGFVEDCLQAQRGPAQALPEQAAQFYRHIHTLIFGLQKGSSWFFRGKRKPAALADSLLSYAQARFQEMLVQRLRTLYGKLLETLPHRLKDLDFCRTRLAEFARSCERASAPSAPTSPAGLLPGRQVLPFTCASIDEVLARIQASLSPADLLEFDERVQAGIGQQFQSLANVCVTSISAFKELPALLQRLAEEMVETRFGETNVAKVYLNRPGGEDALLDDLVKAYDEARPGLSVQTGPEICILAAPGDAAGQRFRLLAGRALPDAELFPAEGGDDIVIYRELPLIPLGQLPQQGPDARKAYEQMASHEYLSPHARSDIREWLPIEE